MRKIDWNSIQVDWAEGLVNGEAREPVSEEWKT
jgi:hypothetical protein